METPNILWRLVSNKASPSPGSARIRARRLPKGWRQRPTALPPVEKGSPSDWNRGLHSHGRNQRWMVWKPPNRTPAPVDPPRYRLLQVTCMFCCIYMSVQDIMHPKYRWGEIKQQTAHVLQNCKRLMWSVEILLSQKQSKKSTADRFCQRTSVFPTHCSLS